MPGTNHVLGKSVGFEDKDSNPNLCYFLAVLGVGISYNIINEAGWMETDKLESKSPLFNKDNSCSDAGSHSHVG